MIERDMSVNENSASPEILESMHMIATGEQVQISETVNNTSPAQKKMTQKAVIAQHISDVLATVTEGPRGEQCLGQEDYYFFEEGEAKSTRDLKEKVAAALCRQCPVVSSCLEDSIEQEEVYGIWGGVSEHARRRLIRNKLAS